jgi:hypothetical protein
MKGLWKSKLSGYNTKGEKRKSQNFTQYILDNTLYNLKHDKYVIEKDNFYLKDKAVREHIRTGKLDDFNKLAQFEANLVDRKVRARTREFIQNANWDIDIKEVYGTKSIAWLIS